MNLAEHITFKLGEKASIQIPAEEVARQLLQQLVGYTEPLRLAATPAMGDYWPGQGGHYAGTYEFEGRRYALIVSTPEHEFTNAPWAVEAKAIVGTESNWDGAANTRALLASGIDCPAAKACASLEIDGHSDFILPSRHQARFAYLNVPQLFDTDPWYWTSTQCAGSSSFAWCQGFGDGTQGYDRKHDKLRARAVRTIQLQ